MDKNFLDMVYLLSCGANGIEPVADFEFDAQKVLDIAKSQGVWHLVFIPIMSLYSKNNSSISEELYNEYNNRYVAECGKQFMRLNYVHNLLKEFEKNEIGYCILKGESVSRFFHTPIARISSDFDILIEPKMIDKCLAIMEKKGFKNGEKVFESHQIECTHPIAGLVEIHTMMYGKKTEDICFNNSIEYTEPYIDVTADDGTIYKTLGFTDGFIFLFLHYVKHFLSEGVGIRQMLDVLLYIKHNFKNIDWQIANKSISNLGFKRFFEITIDIGIKYLNFPKDLFCFESASESLAEKILNDMQKGGLFGHDQKARRGFYDLYLTERYKKTKNKNLEHYKNKRKLFRLFPNRNFMSVNYKYVEKSFMLLPVAWIHRIWDGLFKNSEKSGVDKLENEVFKERLDLIKELDMI